MKARWTVGRLFRFVLLDVGLWDVISAHDPIILCIILYPRTCSSNVKFLLADGPPMNNYTFCYRGVGVLPNRNWQWTNKPP
jgi:hypothetical protein